MSVSNVKQKSLRMPEDLWAALEAESNRQGVPVSELIRQSVVAHLIFLRQLHEERVDDR
jgi:hypothetical protein